VPETSLCVVHLCKIYVACSLNILSFFEFLSDFLFFPGKTAIASSQTSATRLRTAASTKPEWPDRREHGTYQQASKDDPERKF
jgi:hypothetical protein